MNREEARARLRVWVRERSGQEIADDAPIFETGLLSSLDVVELILFIETLKGDEIDANLLDPDVFTSIETILAGFFEGTPGG